MSFYLNSSFELPFDLPGKLGLQIKNTPCPANQQPRATVSTNHRAEQAVTLEPANPQPLRRVQQPIVCDYDRPVGGAYTCSPASYRRIMAADRTEPTDSEEEHD